MYSLAPIPESQPHQEICWELLSPSSLSLCLDWWQVRKNFSETLNITWAWRFDITEPSTKEKQTYIRSPITFTATWWIVMERMAGDLWRHPVIAKHQLCVPWSWTLLLTAQWDQDTRPRRRRRRIYQIVLRPVRFPCPAPAQSPSATKKPCTLPTLLDLKPFLGSNSEWGGGLLLQHNLEKKDMCEEAFLCGSHLPERDTLQAPKESFSYLLFFYRLIILASSASQEKWTEVSLLYWSAAVCSRAISLSTTTEVLIRSQFESEKLSDPTVDLTREKETEQLQPKIANKDYKHSGNKTTTQRSEEYQRWVARYIPYPNKRTTRKK